MERLPHQHQTHTHTHTLIRQSSISIFAIEPKPEPNMLVRYRNNTIIKIHVSADSIKPIELNINNVYKYSFTHAKGARTHRTYTCNASQPASPSKRYYFWLITNDLYAPFCSDNDEWWNGDLCWRTSSPPLPPLPSSPLRVADKFICITSPFSLVAFMRRSIRMWLWINILWQGQGAEETSRDTSSAQCKTNWWICALIRFYDSQFVPKPKCVLMSKAVRAFVIGKLLQRRPAESRCTHRNSVPPIEMNDGKSPSICDNN